MGDQISLKIISGGQTGVDRAALDVALELGLPCGGWCPKKRISEDGLIPSRYPLREMPSPKYPVRTEKNVRESDGTLIFTWGPVTGGTALTVKLARKHQKPYIVVDLSGKSDPHTVLNWLRDNDIKILNVAGPRESKVPGIHDRTVAFLKAILKTESHGNE
jgi:predicted Rossmann fold nucleotide-binding protein DprA/Smf involved in DNA uptake